MRCCGDSQPPSAFALSWPCVTVHGGGRLRRRLEHIAGGGEPQASLSSVLCFGLRGGYVLRLCTRAPGKPAEVLHDTGRKRGGRRSDGLARLLTEAGLLVPLTAFSSGGLGPYSLAAGLTRAYVAVAGGILSRAGRDGYGLICPQRLMGSGCTFAWAVSKTLPVLMKGLFMEKSCLLEF